jgi:SIR2-like domain
MKISEVMNQSLFFLGAGASFDAGCQLSSQMLESLKSLICQEGNNYFSDVEGEAIKFLLSSLKYQCEWRSLEENYKFPVVPNIEELALLIRRIKNRENFLPAPITGNWADKLISFETKFKEIEELQDGYSLFDKIENTIKNSLLEKWLSIESTTYLEVLDEFFESQSREPENFTLEIFSLNNDTVIESHFNDKKIAPYRGFVSGEWRGFNDVNNRLELNRISLYKLHGSMDWVRLSDGKIIESSKLGDLNEAEVIEHNPFIIFGHGTKFFSIEPFFSLVQNLWSKLLERTYYFVIGYSFFDPYINNLLLQAVKQSPYDNKKIIIVNPSFATPPLEDKNFIDLKPFGTTLNEKDSDGKRLLTSYLEYIQRNKFYSDLPEFNIKQIPSDSLLYIKMDTKNFLNTFFKNGGENVKKFIEKLESERLAELPFSHNI